jgi:hypothetical protein
MKKKIDREKTKRMQIKVQGVISFSSIMSYMPIFLNNDVNRKEEKRPINIIYLLQVSGKSNIGKKI